MRMPDKLFKFITSAAFIFITTMAFGQSKPNIIFIYADDLGYGDLSCYGATKITTLNIDALSKQGIRFTNGHADAATCTPSRYSMLTGCYAWRKSGTGILPGDAALIIPQNITTLPSMLQKAGYKTGMVGKWHLGLGTQVNKNWNSELTPGPNEVGFNYSFFFPATADRVPTVFIENHRVVGLDSSDPITVSYEHNVGNDPTGKEHPELLKMHSTPGNGHDQTIVNGIGRIGYMSGGEKARWADEELAFTFLSKAQQFIEENQKQPFFLYFALSDIHVPRMPATMFKGKSELGYRGDAILQMDRIVGEILKQLDYLGLSENTVVIFTSDNGPVLDDGYQDDAVAKQNGHKPAGTLRGGKYSAFEGGTRIPWIIQWPGKINAGTVSDALISQVDMLASLAKLLNQPLSKDEPKDSYDVWDALSGKSKTGRDYLVEEAEMLSIIHNNWKYIEPHPGVLLRIKENIETGNNEKSQLYDLTNDIGETKNIAAQHPDIVKQLAEKLKSIKNSKQ